MVTYRAQSGEDLACATVTAPRLYDLIRLEGQRTVQSMTLSFAI